MTGPVGGLDIVGVEPNPFGSWLAAVGTTVLLSGTVVGGCLVSADFRSEPMDSPEGVGRARAAWEAVQPSKRAKRPDAKSRPAVERAVRHISVPVTLDLVGFWLTWQVSGGYEGLRSIGMSRSAIYRRIKQFRQVFGKHPDEFDMPGISIDVAAYQAARKAELEGNEPG